MCQDNILILINNFGAIYQDKKLTLVSKYVKIKVNTDKRMCQPNRLILVSKCLNNRLILVNKCVKIEH